VAERSLAIYKDKLIVPTMQGKIFALDARTGKIVWETFYSDPDNPSEGIHGNDGGVIVVHGNQAERLPDHYKRYLENAFRTALRIKGSPVRVELRTSDNPYGGRRNTLTPRQARDKKRELRFKKRD